MRNIPLVFLVALALSACGDRVVRTESVEVVVVRCEIRRGNADCNTVVQFPDSTRYMRPGKWGEVGDRFHAGRPAPRYQNWRSP